MIHIMRENETIEDIAYIYGTTTDAIISQNPIHTIYAQNSAVYIPLKNEVYFTDRNISTKELSSLTACDEDELCTKNHLGRGHIIPGNFRVILPRQIIIKKEMISSVYSTKDINSDFVSIDRNHEYASKVFIDCYDVTGTNLNLPEDYPSINACRINDINAGFYIGDVSLFADEDILMQLKHDLRYKSYSEVLLNVKNVAEADSCRYLAECFRSIGLNVSVKSNENVLRSLEYEEYDTLYYSARRNIFDFSSFTNVISELLSIIPARYLGYDMKMCAADIHKESMKITYPDIASVKAVYSLHCPEISYDDISRLCFFRYNEGGVHNVIYEDMRTLYAKACFLRERGVEKFLTDGLSPALGYIAGGF